MANQIVSATPVTVGQLKDALSYFDESEFVVFKEGALWQFVRRLEERRIHGGECASTINDQPQRDATYLFLSD
jgi:hypothetical protein